MYLIYAKSISPSSLLDLVKDLQAKNKKGWEHNGCNTSTNVYCDPQGVGAEEVGHTRE